MWLDARVVAMVGEGGGSPASTSAPGRSAPRATGSCRPQISGMYFMSRSEERAARLGPARPPQRLGGSLVTAAPEGRPVRDYSPMLPPHGAFVMVSSTGAPASFLNDTSVVPAVASTSTRA